MPGAVRVFVLTSHPLPARLLPPLSPPIPAVAHRGGAAALPTGALPLRLAPAGVRLQDLAFRHAAGMLCCWRICFPAARHWIQPWAAPPSAAALLVLRWSRRSPLCLLLCVPPPRLPRLPPSRARDAAGTRARARRLRCSRRGDGPRGWWRARRAPATGVRGGAALDVAVCLCLTRVLHLDPLKCC